MKTDVDGRREGGRERLAPTNDGKGAGDNRRRVTTAQLQHCPSCDRSDASAHWRLLHASMQAVEPNKAGADAVASLVLVELRSCLLKRPPINGKHQLGLLMRDN